MSLSLSSMTILKRQPVGLLNVMPASCSVLPRAKRIHLPYYKLVYEKLKS